MELQQMVRRCAFVFICAVMAEGAGVPLRLGGYYEENRGQLPGGVAFRHVQGRMQVSLESGGVRLVAGAGKASEARLKFAGSRKAAVWKGENRLASVSHYFIGSDPAKWRTQVAHYAQVRMEGLWEGIDVVFHSGAGMPEFDFVTAPGVDVSQVRIHIEGAEGLRIEEGDLILKLHGGEYRIHRPKAFAETENGRVEVKSRYVLITDAEVQLEVESDARTALLIDPVITFSTLMGGDKSENGTGLGQIRTDSAGNIYAAGTSLSAEMPGWPMVSPFGGGTSADAFLIKTDAAGKLQFATYFGGGGTEELYGLAIDDLGRIVVGGATASTDFPTKRPLHGRKQAFDGFVARFTPQGELDYSTYFGGSDADMVRAVTLDSQRRIVLTGSTGSTDLPVKNALMPEKPNTSRCRYVLLGVLETTVSCRTVFVAKLDADSGELLFSTYLGGSRMNTSLLEGDLPNAIALDFLDNIYVAGQTAALNFPVTEGVIGASASGSIDGFITKLSPEGGGPYRSTYFGGPGADYVLAMAVDGDGNPYVCGPTASTRFPLANATQQTNAGGTADAFVAKLNEEMTKVLFSTYHGGSKFDVCLGLALAPDGTVVAAGGTDSDELVTKAPLQPMGGDDDGFLAVFDVNGTLMRSSYFGGSKVDTITGIALGANGDLYLTGQTNSEDFPLVSALQSTVAGSYDAFVTSVSGMLTPEGGELVKPEAGRRASGATPADAVRLTAARLEDGRILLRAASSGGVMRSARQAIQYAADGALEIWIGERRAALKSFNAREHSADVVIEGGPENGSGEWLTIRNGNGTILRSIPVTGMGVTR